MNKLELPIFNKQQTLNVIMLTTKKDLKRVNATITDRKFKYKGQYYHEPTNAIYKTDKESFAIYFEGVPNPIEKTEVYNPLNNKNEPIPVYDCKTTQELIDTKIIKEAVSTKDGTAIEFIKKCVIVLLVMIGYMLLQSNGFSISSMVG